MKDPQKLEYCNKLLRKLEAIALVKGQAKCESLIVRHPSFTKDQKFTYIAYLYNNSYGRDFDIGQVDRDVAIQRIAMLNHREQENILITDGAAE